MPLPTKKRRRKPSKDKSIEALLVMKDDWNFLASSFINELIALKRGMNGRGDSTYMLPPGKVTNPEDPKVSNFINQLSNKYRVLSTKALEIVRKQEELSRERKQHQQQKAQQHSPTGEPSNPFSSLTHAASAVEQNLVAEASNPLSRVLFKTKSLFSKDPHRSQKWKILNFSVNALKATRNLQNAAVTNVNSSDKLNQYFDEVERYIKDIGTYLTTLVDANDPRKGLLTQTDPRITEIRFYQDEFDAAYSIGFRSLRSKFSHLLHRLNNAADENEKNVTLQKIRDLHDRAVAAIKQNYPNEFKTNISQLEKDLPENLTNAKNISTIEDGDIVDGESDEEENVKPLIAQLNYFQREFDAVSMIGFPKYRASFNSMRQQFVKSNNLDDKNIVLDNIKNYYGLVVDVLKQKFPEDFKTDIVSLQKKLPLTQKNTPKPAAPIATPAPAASVPVVPAPVVPAVPTPTAPASAAPAAPAPAAPAPASPEQNVTPRPKTEEVERVQGNRGDKFRSSAAHEKLQKVAHNFMSRWLKKKILQLPFAHDTGLFRVSIYDKADVLMDKIKGFMDSVENGDSVDDLLTSYKDMKNLLQPINTDKSNIINLSKQNEDKARNKDKARK